MADLQQAIAALEQAREFVKSQHDPTHGPSCQCLDAHDNINKGIAALQALGAARGVKGTEAPRELLREGYEVMRALMRKSDASLDRNAEFAAVAAWWTKAQGGTPLMQPLEALALGVDLPDGGKKA